MWCLNNEVNFKLYKLSSSQDLVVGLVFSESWGSGDPDGHWLICGHKTNWDPLVVSFYEHKHEHEYTCRHCSYCSSLLELISGPQSRIHWRQLTGGWGIFCQEQKILYLSSITGLEIVVTSDTKIIWKQRRTCLSSREERTIRWLTSNKQLINLGSNQTRVCSVLMNAVKSSISLKLYFMSILQTQNVMRLMISGRRHYCGTLSEPLRSLVMRIFELQ